MPLHQTLGQWSELKSLRQELRKAGSGKAALLIELKTGLSSFTSPFTPLTATSRKFRSADVPWDLRAKALQTESLIVKMICELAEDSSLPAGESLDEIDRLLNSIENISWDTYRSGGRRHSLSKVFS